MRSLVLLLAVLVTMAACNKKSVPSKTSNVTLNAPNSKEGEAAENSADINSNKDSGNLAPVAPPIPSAMIVIDGYGKVLTPKAKLPPGSHISADYSQIARAFTPQQLANLKARYKTVPPKVLYVPQQYALKSLKGTYCIYKKKFWYWKKDDGLFYIDQMYYQ